MINVTVRWMKSEDALAVSAGDTHTSRHLLIPVRHAVQSHVDFFVIRGYRFIRSHRHKSFK